MACEICMQTYNSEFFDNIDADSSVFTGLQFEVKQASRSLSVIAELLVFLA